MTNDLALSILSPLFDKGTATAQDIGQSPVYMQRAEQQGLVRRVGTVKSGRRGRPAIQWRCTDKARKRVKRSRGC